MRTLLVALVACGVACAGVVRVAVYPVRHPVRGVERVVRGVSYPLRHPMRFHRHTRHIVKVSLW